MAKPTKEQKAKRRVTKTARKAAKSQRRARRERTREEFGDGLGQLEVPRDPEDFSQAGARIVKQATEG